jgi:hypothetical protein
VTHLSRLKAYSPTETPKFIFIKHYSGWICATIPLLAFKVFSGIVHISHPHYYYSFIKINFREFQKKTQKKEPTNPALHEVLNKTPPPGQIHFICQFL